MMIGTAGHIDHGKTSLVRALTGVDTDRLPEEKARGMSIELGYAFWQPAQADLTEPIAFIDVPGHEKLLHTMIAGATGIDFALLLVAADDGVMPQTREHLAVLSLLGVKRGIVVLTKIDRVDDARLVEVRGEVQALLAGTGLAGAPVMAVSAVTGAGLDALRDGLLAQVRQTAVRQAGERPGEAFRLAIDRVFTLDGVGTVATGTVHAGRVRAGDTLAQWPDGLMGLRVRSVHAQNRKVDEACRGQRCALNLVGVEPAQIPRGHWLSQPDMACVSGRLDVELTWWAAESKALRSGSRVHVHLGTTACPAAVALLQGDALAPGQSALVQLVLSQPLAAWHGDRLILRDAAGQRVVGGGQVLDPCAPARYRRTPQRLQLLQALQQPTLSARLAGLLAVAETGVDLRQWQRVFGLRDLAAFEPALTGLACRRLADDYLMGEAVWQQLQQTVLTTLAQYHATAPEEMGPDAARLRRLARLRLDDAHWRLALEALRQTGQLARSGAFVHLPEHGAHLQERDVAVLQRLTPYLQAAAAQGAWVRDLAELIHEPAGTLRPVMARLARAGQIYQVVKDLYLDAATTIRLANLCRQLAQPSAAPPSTAPAVLTVAAFRDASGLGRKRAVQVLEFFDRMGLCRRVGDAHVLRPESDVFRA